MRMIVIAASRMVKITFYDLYRLGTGYREQLSQGLDSIIGQMPVITISCD